MFQQGRHFGKDNASAKTFTALAVSQQATQTRAFFLSVVSPFRFQLRSPVLQQASTVKFTDRNHNTIVVANTPTITSVVAIDYRSSSLCSLWHSSPPHSMYSPSYLTMLLNSILISKNPNNLLVFFYNPFIMMMFSNSVLWGMVPLWHLL
ncbi:hypothetical protein VNO78_05561 [Psophocarpus tetragonolobus]|uniref:Uncharacterized protein n=1 Tax=Psophocarpus tetragonolobus TaxID=3891 RepID=A0AAN9SR94_PSOTE